MASANRVEELFHGALDLPDEGERARWLRRHTEGDPDLEREVLELLEGAGVNDGFLATSGAPRPSNLQARTGEMVGEYRLSSRLGGGASGEVYLCQREGTDLPEAAIKLLGFCRGKEPFLRRFEDERRALGKMDHPGVARLLDAGITEEGEAFLVMERVDGVPLTVYAAENRLSVRQRLALLREVALAVAHAHERGIVHRDLKPSNILVAHVDGDPLPKVIDFGIACAIELSPGGPSDWTFAGTPGYMAPEQASRDGDAVDERADVFSLGVILFELLTGTTPLPRSVIEKTRIEDLRAAVEAPVLPLLRERLAELESTASTAVPEQAAPLDGLGDALVDELEACVGRALAVERAERFDDARVFVDELERILRALDPATVFQAKRIRSIDSVQLGAKIRRELSLASAASLEREGADETTRRRELGALERVLGRINFTTVARHVAAEALLGGEVSDHSAEAADAPLIRASLLQAQADVLLREELHERAGPILEEAVELRTQHLGEGAPETLESLGSLARYYRITSQPERARPLYERCVQGWERAQGPRHRRTLEARMNLGILHVTTGEWFVALEYLRPVVELGRDALGEASESWLRAANNLGAVYEQLCDLTAAAENYRAAWRGLTELRGPEHLETLGARGNLGRVLSELGEYVEAIELLSGSVPAIRSLLGDDHPHTLLSLYSLGVVLRNAGRAEEALVPAREALEGFEAQTPIHREHAIVCRAELAWTTSKSGRTKEGLALGLEAVELARTHLNESHPQWAGAQLLYARCLAADGQAAAAKTQIEAARDALVEAFGSDHAVLDQVAAAERDAAHYDRRRASP